jgi:hypothetical protein
MGEVIQFPDEAELGRRGRVVDTAAEPATVIILPVVRIDRDNPDGSGDVAPATGNGRRRRRRAAR